MTNKINFKQAGLLVIMTALLVLTACGAKANEAATSGAKNEPQPLAQTQPAETDPKADWPKELNFGVLPGEEEDELSRGNKEFAEDMSEALGIPVNLFVGEDYTAVIEAMRTKKIDIASFGPFSYTIAAERSGAVAFAVKAESEETAVYNSLIVVPAKSDIQTLEELRGKNFLFADPASTSGHLFPRAFLINKLEITNEEIENGFFGNLSFSGGHDKSILAIARGDADGAGVCSSCIERVVKAGLVKESDYRVIGTSDPIPSSPFTYRKDLPESLVEEIKAFIFNYHNVNPEWFEKDKKKQFFPVTDEDYKIIYDTAKTLNMTADELLK